VNASAAAQKTLQLPVVTLSSRRSAFVVTTSSGRRHLVVVVSSLYRCGVVTP
jgi:hypothetical protein